MRVVFRKTVVGDRCFNYLSGSHLQNQDVVTLDSEDDSRSGNRTVSQHARTVFLKITLYPDDHAKQITDTPGLKSFNNNYNNYDNYDNKSLFSRIYTE